MTLKNARKTFSRLQHWCEALSMCRWILLTVWRGRSCAIAVLTPGPMVVVCLRELADLRILTKEMENSSYNLEMRFQGHSP